VRLSRWRVANHDNWDCALRHHDAALQAQCRNEQGLQGETGSSNMSENVRFEIPKEMRAMAEASFEQARKTFERFLDGAK
jgi:hypothetical protein